MRDSLGLVDKRAMLPDFSGTQTPVLISCAILMCLIASHLVPSLIKEQRNCALTCGKADVSLESSDTAMGPVKQPELSVMQCSYMWNKTTARTHFTFTERQQFWFVCVRRGHRRRCTGALRLNESSPFRVRAKGAAMGHRHRETRPQSG